jgi:hypothetical protein
MIFGNIESNRHLSSALLFGAAGGYALLNFIAISLAARGVVHSPWGILVFFTWIGPATLAFGLFSFQFVARRRFSWLAVILFLLATGVAVLINLHIYGLALAAV